MIHSTFIRPQCHVIEYTCIWSQVLVLLFLDKHLLAHTMLTVPDTEICQNFQKFSIFQKRFPLNLFNIQDKWGITQLPILICPFFPCIRTTIKAYPRCHDFHIYLCFFVKCKAWKEGFESKLFRPNIKFWLQNCWHSQNLMLIYV